MNHRCFIVDHETQGRLFILPVPEGIETVLMEDVPSVQAWPPTELLASAWYSSLKQGIDWRFGYSASNPRMFDEPKGGTSTYYFELLGERINFAVFEAARTRLTPNEQQHFLSVAQNKVRLNLRTLFKLWVLFNLEYDRYLNKKQKGWV